MVHVAMLIKHDLLNTPGHSMDWHGLDQEHMKAVVPDSLYLFLRLLFGGTDLLEDDENNDPNLIMKILNIAQDIVFAVSNCRKLTPKHIGLGLTLHQATRSEFLVNMFHKANHTIGIDTVRRFDTSIACDILKKFELNNFVYISDTIVKGRMLQCSFDNIDVLESTLDGKNTFHSTQLVVWQRGPAAEVSGNIDIGTGIQRKRAIKPESLKEFQKIDIAKLPLGKQPCPTMPIINIEDWFTQDKETSKANLTDFTWVISRAKCNAERQSVPAWSSFNEAISVINPPVTTASMLPILQAKADENDTITTVINRFISISQYAGQKHTIITCDMPLYSKGKKLVWANPHFKDVIFCLGGLHSCFNFLKAIGQHMESAGLDDLWTDSGIYAANTTESMLAGKAYYRAVRGHTLTYEALWRILLPKYEAWLNVNHAETKQINVLAKHVGSLFDQRQEVCRDDIHESVSKLAIAIQDENVLNLIKDFDSQFETNPNYRLWRTYMRMVEILLNFIRAERDGNWHLHLEAFEAMLPWLTVYDHTNYFRWGPVYLADMKALSDTAPEVYSEFVAGNFVVKRSEKRFNQIPIDQGTEWMNKTCKLQNGIIGITQNDQARDKFCITWAERSNISLQTRYMLGMEEDSDETVFTRDDALPSRMQRDEQDVKKLEMHLQRFDVFRLEMESNDGDEQLISIATKDIASSDITSDLQSAEECGMESVRTFVNTRLINKTVSLYDPLKRHNSKTFKHLYKSTVKMRNDETKIIKCDRKLMQKLLNAATFGRNVDLENILKHELSPVPLSLAKINGDLNATQKADLLHLLSNDVDIPYQIPSSQLKTCICIDGHALIQALGKPLGCQTFGEYAKVFVEVATKQFDKNTTRIDVVFDRYMGDISIKACTRAKRTSSKKKTIRKAIDGSEVPLPVVWQQFIALDDNKADLARFLSEELVRKGKQLQEPYELITSGGFLSATDVLSSKKGPDIDLHANHEEADTRLILHSLHALKSGFERILVMCQDTDVLVMLIHFLGKAKEVWMIAGTSMKRKCYPVHTIANMFPQSVTANLIGFHALTGCDTTSSFAGKGKTTCWKTFIQIPSLLHGIGKDTGFTDAEKYVCHLYGCENETNIDKVRYRLFSKGKKDLEKLPPTQDALQLHLARANFQAKIWLNSNQSLIDIIQPKDTGAWEERDSQLRVVWSRLPSIPKSCLDLITCNCKTKCGTVRCTCFKKDMTCTPACACDAVNCCNPAGQY